MNERGFSLAELLVVVAVLALILTGVIALQQQGQIAYLIGSNRVETQQNVRVASALMTREIREACSLVATLTSSVISITVVNPDPAVAGPSVDCTTASTSQILQVKYQLGAGALANTLLRLFANSGSALPAAPADCNGANAQYCVIGGVDALTFTGYDMNDATATTASTPCAASVACSVKISLKTKSEETLATYAPGNVRAWLDSRVRLRNI